MQYINLFLKDNFKLNDATNPKTIKVFWALHGGVHHKDARMFNHCSIQRLKNEGI